MSKIAHNQRYIQLFLEIPTLVFRFVNHIRNYKQMNRFLQLFFISLFVFVSFPKVEAQVGSNIAIDKTGFVENGEIRADKFGLKPGESKEKQTKALQAIIDLYADNVPRNSWDINMQNPEPTIVLPAGEYNVGEVELRSYVTIKGSGRGSTVLKGATFKAEGQYNITIEDLSFIGNVGATKESKYDLESNKRKSAFRLSDCARLIFKNVSIKNYDVAFDNHNTYLVDLYSCYISYCNVCYLNDGSGNGYGGHAVRWFGGEMCCSAYGFIQKNGCGVFINGATIEECKVGINLVYPVSFTINACYFESNGYDIYGTLVHVNIENNYFSENGKVEGDAYIYAPTAIGFALFQGNKFGKPVSGKPHIIITQETSIYNNIMIGLNDIVHGGRIPVSERLLPFVVEKGVATFQSYLPNGSDMIMGQTVIYQNPKSGKYYLVTRDRDGKLMYLPFSYDFQ